MPLYESHGADAMFRSMSYRWIMWKAGSGEANASSHFLVHGNHTPFPSARCHQMYGYCKVF